jgi:hypothetical protein
MDKFVKPESKKPYLTPQLIVYGTVRELTQMVGSAGQNDGGPPRGTHKTHIGGF